MFAKYFSLKISAKIPALVVGASIIVAVSVGLTSILTATKNAETANAEKLDALLADRAEALKQYLRSIEQDLRSVSANPFTLAALNEFHLSWKRLEGNPAEILQRAYIADNPNPTGEKEKLDRAAGKALYHDIHVKYHPWFRTFLRQRDYYDIFLFDLDGNLVYSVFKELDYATNLETGQWKDSDLGKAFRAARDSQKPGSIHFFDFHAYAPSHGAAASFISTPLFEGDKKIGILAFQMPIARINTVMGNRSGLGKTGETFIVGQDGLMRSDSPFSEKSTILKTKIDNTAITSALAGSPAKAYTNQYRNLDLEVHAIPFGFHAAKWALVAAIGLDEENAPIVAMRNQIIVISFLCLLVTAIIGIFMARGITRPLTRIVDAMNKLAEGETKIDTGADGRRDEIGAMAKAVSVFRDNAIDRSRLEGEHAQMRNKAEQDRKNMMRELANNFTASVGSIVETVSTTSSQLQSTAQTMEGIAEQTSDRALSVSAASEQASVNVQTVAASTEEMSNSVAEITRNVVDSAAAAQKAAEGVAATRSQMSELAGVADSIGGVVNMISDIAEQTNLLALNATIESARAGDAGRGFGVVANEVKELAGQTAQATGEIAAQIQKMQTATNQAVESMEHITAVISHVDETSTAIASAMEEQGAATQEIAKNVQEASSGTQAVSENIAGVSQASEEAGQAAHQVKSATGELYQQSEKLQAEVAGFLAKLRQGDANRRERDDPDYKGPDRRGEREEIARAF